MHDGTSSYILIQKENDLPILAIDVKGIDFIIELKNELKFFFFKNKSKRKIKIGCVKLCVFPFVHRTFLFLNLILQTVFLSSII